LLDNACMSFLADSESRVYFSVPPKIAKKLKLRSAIVRSLQRQGYVVKGGRISVPEGADKDYLRSLHRIAAEHRIAEANSNLRRQESRLLQFIANGSEVSPRDITPRLVPVVAGSDLELLFRFVTLHWSVPVSPGYGRRLRFLVFDEYNHKLIGLFAVGDPVYALSDRDTWVGWNSRSKRIRLYHAMDAYVLGAVPPYSSMLGGKLISLLALSNEVRDAFRNRYKGRKSLISGKVRRPHLVLLTTTSALGRSSMYNRLRVDGVAYWSRIGFTKGYGEFQFSNGLYGSIRDFAERFCEPTDRREAWGDGFRNKREVVRKTLEGLGFGRKLLNHGIRREIFAAPLASNAAQFLRGEVQTPKFYNWPAKELSRVALQRWVIPRAERDSSFRDFDRELYRLWEK
jgi:hypothetical protein